MPEVAVQVMPTGEAYLALVVGPAPEVRELVALDALRRQSAGRLGEETGRAVSSCYRDATTLCSS
jgi:hypothetical protein